ncbi:phenylacetate--CoA ligase family protein [Streptomyces sp. NPDC096198]|uniref:phenylacetate--CoA ligase family protein n=1 Tax=Streptomyces sp. NPDC096198 TaxID=3366080 RepID=UPI00381C84E7
MTGHHWWHNASLRTAAAVGEGWRLFQTVYLPGEYDRETLELIRRERLAGALHRAALTSYFAPHLAKTPVLPEQAESVLAGLPVLEKEVLRHSPEAVTTGLVDAWDELRVHTSGTTGDPVWITHDDSRLTESAATNLRFLAAYGLSPGLRMIRATADPAHAPVAFETMHYLGGALVLRINVSSLSPRDTLHLERLCADFKPDILWGQPLEVLLAALRQQEGTLRLPKLSAVFTHGDSFDAGTRETITQVFGCPHYDQYGLQEFGRVGWECPQSPGTYHVEEERLAVSVDDDSHILISSLTNRAMSLLRYRPGDRVRLLHEPCPCGRPHARMTGLAGRKRALIADADGTLVNVKRVRAVLDRTPLHRWQVRQQEAGRLEVLIVPVDPADGARTAEELRGELAGTVKLDELTVRPVELVELATAAGKAPQFRLFTTQHTLSDAVAQGTSPR